MNYTSDVEALKALVDKYEILNVKIERPGYKTKFNNRHEVINDLTNKSDTYLEIGVENGYTFNNVHFLNENKTGVDPDPKCNNKNVIKLTSDDFFKENQKKQDVIFIDGMHHAEYVLRDFSNSMNILTENGSIFIDDIIPLNYNEQLRIPGKHYYENDILKYGEEWTGDVWKTIYYLLVHYKEVITISYYYNINYRGIAHIKIKEPFTIIENDAIVKIKQYEYFKDFNNYLQLLTKQ